MPPDTQLFICITQSLQCFDTFGSETGMGSPSSNKYSAPASPKGSSLEDLWGCRRNLE